MQKKTFESQYRVAEAAKAELTHSVCVCADSSALTCARWRSQQQLSPFAYPFVMNLTPLTRYNFARFALRGR